MDNKVGTNKEKQVGKNEAKAVGKNEQKLQKDIDKEAELKKKEIVKSIIKNETDHWKEIRKAAEIEVVAKFPGNIIVGPDKKEIQLGVKKPAKVKMPGGEGLNEYMDYLKSLDERAIVVRKA